MRDFELVPVVLTCLIRVTRERDNKTTSVRILPLTLVDFTIDEATVSEYPGIRTKITSTRNIIMDLGINHNSTQQISKPDPEFENASDQIEIDFCISFDVLLILESQRGWCELSRDGSYSSVAKLMYFRITLDSQLKKIIPVGYLSKVNFRGDSRRCPKAILPRSDPATISNSHGKFFSSILLPLLLV